MDVLKTDAHVNLDECLHCLIDFDDLSNIMWAYTTRMLSPSGNVVEPGSQAEAHLLEYHSSGFDSTYMNARTSAS
jgi:hypothetical protein